MEATLFTIGHSHRPLSEFVDVLKQYRVTALCDVRSVPFSMRNPQFNRDDLGNHLRACDIAYAHLPELGARAKSPAVYHQGKAQYGLIAKTPRFQRGLERVLEGSTRYCMALMCAERDPITCHRTILVTRHLRISGLRIVHIIDRDACESNERMELRLLRAAALMEGDIFTPTAQLIEMAYDIQGERIAYVAPSSDGVAPRGDLHGTD